MVCVTTFCGIVLNTVDFLLGIGTQDLACVVTGCNDLSSACYHLSVLYFIQRVCVGFVKCCIKKISIYFYKNNMNRILNVQDVEASELCRRCMKIKLQ